MKTLCVYFLIWTIFRHAIEIQVFRKNIEIYKLNINLFLKNIFSEMIIRYYILKINTYQKNIKKTHK